MDNGTRHYSGKRLLLVGGAAGGGKTLLTLEEIFRDGRNRPGLLLGAVVQSDQWKPEQQIVGWVEKCWEFIEDREENHDGAQND